MGGGGGGGGRSQIIRRRESPISNKSLNTLSGVHPLSEHMKNKKTFFRHLADSEVELTEIFFADNIPGSLYCKLLIEKWQGQIGKDPAFGRSRGGIHRRFFGKNHYIYANW